MTPRRRRRGFALLSALWLLVAISALALELSIVARYRRLVVANILESVRAERAAESGVEEERARLARLLAGGGRLSGSDANSIVDPWRDAGAASSDTVSVGDAAYRVVTTDAGTMVQLNLVDETGLARFLSASSIDPLTADALAQAIMDWRDADDFRRLRGAEREEYIKSGARELPANGPFESVDDLRFVRGMTRSILARIAPRMTVFGSGEVNVNRASEPVLLSVPGMTSLAASAIVGAQQAHRRIDNVRQLLDMLPLPARTSFEQQPRGLARLTFETHEVEVRSTGWVEGSPIRVTETALLTRMGATPVVTWRRIE
jgi:general secretion pathway protein K